MNRVSLLAAGGIVVIANAFGLVHAWRNRGGPPEAEITLSERELALPYAASEDDSGVALQLRWMMPGDSSGPRPSMPWLDGEKALRELGFDTSLPVSTTGDWEFYRRQRARLAFVALEYEGPAWREYLERAASSGPVPAGRPHQDSETHLFAIDAAPDPARLRSRHPDRSSVIVVPAVVRIAPLSDPTRLSGWIQMVPNSIHVPRPYSDAFRQIPSDRGKVQYRVTLRYGASLEPSIAGVALGPPAR